MLTLRISLDRGRVDRGKAWVERSGLVERGGSAWAWLRHDERGRVVGLVVASVAVSIAVSLLATALVRAVESRRAAGAAVPDREPAGDAAALADAEAMPGDAPAAEAPTAPTGD